MDLCLLGLPGSGKSWLATFIQSAYGLEHISTGAVARELAAADPNVRVALRAGRYAPEGAIRLEVQQRLERAAVERGGYVLDGFPRTLAQLVALLGWVDAEPMFLHVDRPVYECLTRLTARGRDDDLPDGIAAKLENYEQYTRPVLTLLESAGRLYTINASSDGDPQGDVERLLDT